MAIRGFAQSLMQVVVAPGVCDSRAVFIGENKVLDANLIACTQCQYGAKGAIWCAICAAGRRVGCWLVPSGPCVFCMLRRRGC